MKNKLQKIIKYKKNHSFGETIDWLFNHVKKVFKNNRKYAKNYNYLKLTNAEKKNFLLKSEHKIFIFGNIPYYDIGGGQRSSQIAKTFNKMGYPVYYVYGYKSSESKIHNIAMPLCMHNYIENIKITDFEKIILKDDLFIFEAPSKKYDKYIDLAKEKKAKIIYENIDNWETSLGNNLFDKDTLNKLLINADLLVGSAKPLVNQLQKYCNELNITKEILYLANAVDDEMFFPLKNYEKPSDLVIGTKTLIYYGSLWGEWFDWNIIFDIAKHNPEYQINLIGDSANIYDIVKKSPKNIHYLGLKKQEDLPSYLKFSDYATIPFKLGKIGDFVSPLKIFEYISMYTNVLTTKLPDVENYPNTYYGNTAAEWEKIIKKDNLVDKAMADDFISRNNWTSRVQEMLKFIYVDKNTCNKNYYKNISIVVLNYNNKDIIDRCIDSLIRNNKRYDYEIVVVDNQSTDGSYEQLLKKYKNKITLIKNTKNGCSSGRNLGVLKSKYENILFLDSDQWAMNNYWIDPYFEILSKNSKVGLIGWAAGWFNKYKKAYNTVDNYPNRSIYPLTLARDDIGYLGSGGMFITKKLFNKIEGFDVNYDPTCYEDTDLSLKVRNQGYELYYCPYLGVMHLPHQTTKDGSLEHTKLNNEKQNYFLEKWNKINPDLLKYIK